MRYVIFTLIMMTLTSVVKGDDGRFDVTRHDANIVMKRIWGVELYDTSFMKAHYELKEGWRHYHIKYRLNGKLEPYQASDQSTKLCKRKVYISKVVTEDTAFNNKTKIIDIHNIRSFDQYTNSPPSGSCSDQKMWINSFVSRYDANIVIHIEHWLNYMKMNVEQCDALDKEFCTALNKDELLRLQAIYPDEKLNTYVTYNANVDHNFYYGAFGFNDTNDHSYVIKFHDPFYLNDGVETHTYNVASKKFMPNNHTLKAISVKNLD